MSEALTYCGEMVRANDRDRFLLSLFAPEEAREDLWALFAFNHEIAKTREVVSEPQLGLIRLQWWRDEIGNIYGGGKIPEHEVLKPLAGAIQRRALPREAFETLIEAREFDLEATAPANIEGFISYADFTTTPLMSLAAHVTGANPEYEPVRQVAVNYALAGLLRAAPYRRGKSFLPEDLMKKYRLRADRLESGENLSAMARELSAQFVEGVKPEDRVLRAAQRLAHIYMKQIAGARYDLLSPRLSRPPKFKEIRLLAGSLAA